ncbi:MAG: hypothetical protein JXA49_09440 [Actinobacteria bacterium]|nr:hypothetical protein [Actinomycetota bacterium]
MELTLDLFEQLEDLYQIKSRHLKYLNSLFPESWQTTIPRGYGDIWEKRDWKFYLKDYKPFPKPLKLILPDRRQLLFWTLLGFANELISQVSPESLASFLDRHVDNPSARKNLEELFLGQDRSGMGFKAFGSMVVCAQEENRMIDRYLPMLRAFAEHDPRHFGVDEELRSLSLGFFREIDDLIRYLDSDVFLFKRFNRDMKELFRGEISVGVLGVGVANSVVALSRENMDGRGMNSDMAYTKMPPFPDIQTVEYYQEIFGRYHDLLKEAGLNPPAHGIKYVSRKDGKFTVFITQRILSRESSGIRIVKDSNDEECLAFFELILDEIMKVARYNNGATLLKVGIDARIMNWGLKDYDPRNLSVENVDKLYYLDTGIPMIREKGEDLLDPDLMLMGLPGFAKPIIRTLFLKRYWKRFYNTREMVLDVIADFIANGRTDITERMVAKANAAMEVGLPGFTQEKITSRSVKKRISVNRQYGLTFNMFKRVDRFVKVKVLRRKHQYRVSAEDIGFDTY